MERGVKGKKLTMIQEPEEPTNARPTSSPSEDTIELVFTREQQLALSRAAESGHATTRSEESGHFLAVLDGENFPSSRTARIDLIGNVCFAAVVLAVAAVALWPAPDRHPPAPAIISVPAVAEVTAARPAEPQGEPLRIKNAFDATEVFEFPTGTAESEAREAVAALLLDRARERRADGPAHPRLGSVLPGRRAIPPREVFVTRLPAPARDSWNATN